MNNKKEFFLIIFIIVILVFCFTINFICTSTSYCDITTKVICSITGFIIGILIK